MNGIHLNSGQGDLLLAPNDLLLETPWMDAGRLRSPQAAAPGTARSGQEARPGAAGTFSSSPHLGGRDGARAKSLQSPMSGALALLTLYRLLQKSSSKIKHFDSEVIFNSLFVYPQRRSNSQGHGS